MSIDLSRFQQAFFDEAAEHLEHLEQILVAIDLNSPERDDLDALFRVAHSIKGGSGTFGFSEMASFTHIMESVLDALRERQIPLTHQLVDLILAAGDVLGELLCEYRDGVPAHPERRSSVAGNLKTALETGGTSGGSITPVAAATTPATPAANRRYDVAYRTAISGDDRAAAFESLHEALAELGTLTTDSAQQVEVWHFVLQSTCDESAVREPFAFIGAAGDQLDICVVPLADQPNTDQPTAAYGFFDDEPAAPEKPAAYGFFCDEPAVPEPRNPADSAQTATTSPAPGSAAKKDVKQSDAGTIRVELKKVDTLINVVGEMVIAEATLTQVAARFDETQNEDLHAAIELVKRHTRELREHVMSVRMVPMSFVCGRFPRMIRDLASQLGKNVSLQTIGDDTELDKGLIEQIIDPLTHLVRNSLDHGIELPETRAAEGKPEQATVTIRSSHQGGNVVIEVIDDGHGLDREKILAKARAAGIAVADEPSDYDVWQLVFAPGLSTAESVSDLSGRGVGMDVVQRNIHALGGRVDINSIPRKGTTVTIRLPLTLAIVDGLSVTTGANCFIVPLNLVVESTQPLSGNVKELRPGESVLFFREEFIPVIELYRIFNLPRKTARFEDGIFVVVEAQGRKGALFVDDLEAEHQVVIKSLESNYRRVDGIAGATSLGDGRIAFILDVARLLDGAVPPGKTRELASLSRG